MLSVTVTSEYVDGTTWVETIFGANVRASANRAGDAAIQPEVVRTEKYSFLIETRILDAWVSKLQERGLRCFYERFVHRLLIKLRENTCDDKSGEL